jgi:sulfur-carrier protein
VATLRLFASAREAAGVARVELDGATVGDVLNVARARYGEHFAAVLATSRVWLNGEETRDDEPVAAGDEVAVLPPVSGG